MEITLRPDAGARECVIVSRLSIVLMALLAGGAALLVQSIAEVWLLLIWFVLDVPRWVQIPAIALASVVTWVAVSLFGPANDTETLKRFASRVRPPGPGWRRFRADGDGPSQPMAPLVRRFIAGLALVFGSLFGIGYLILGSWPLSLALLVGSAALWAWVWRPQASRAPGRPNGSPPPGSG